MMRDVWRGESKARKGRKGRKAATGQDGHKAFYWRLAIFVGLYLLAAFFAGAPAAPLNWLLVLPFMCLPGLLVFGAGRGGAGRLSGSGGSSSSGGSGGGFSGGGGSSGGGGASGGW